MNFELFKRLVFTGALVLLISTSSINAQSSLVPSFHPVYEWLYIQRVKGELPYYDYESLPLNRGAILNHLKELNKKSADFSSSERKTLQSFLQEFDPDYLLDKSTIHSFFQPGQRISFNRFKEWIWSNNEKHIFSFADSTKFFVFDHGIGRRFFLVREENGYNEQYFNLLQNFRAYGSMNNHLGFHIEYNRAVPFANFTSRKENIFRFDPYYNNNWKALRGLEEINFHYEAYASFTYSLFEISLGRGNLKEGVGLSENLVFSRSSIATDWVRLKIEGKYIEYSLHHITMSWRITRKPFPGDSSITTNNSPQRFTAYHKVTLKPFSWLKASFYEMINYSNRGIELAYLNPVNRYAFAEWELQDQDNGWNGGYLVLRPLKDIEAYTEILIDDLGEFSDIYSKKKFPGTSRFGRRYGLSFAHKFGLQLWTEYTRIDPFTYSHPFDLNAHTDKGIGLGSQIGPNADRLEFGIKKWGAGRTFISASYSYDRQGLDIYNDKGERIFLAGASVNDGRDLPIEYSNRFLDGDLHRWHRLKVEAQWEFKRAYIIKTHLEQRLMIEGTQLPDLTIFWIDLVIGL